MRRYHLASIALAGACTTPSPIGQTYATALRIASQRNCPIFAGVSTTPSGHDLRIMINADTVSYAGGTTRDVAIGDPDDGVSSVLFSVDLMWMTGTTPVPVSIRYEGTAQYDNLDLVGTVTFPTANPETDRCEMTLTLFGFEE